MAAVNGPVCFTITTVLGATWHWEFGDGTSSSAMVPVLAWSAPSTYTVTLSATGGACTDVFSMDISVASATGITSVQRTGDLAVWAGPSDLVIEHAFGEQPVQVDVYDATGRLAISRSNLVKPGRITIGDQDLGTGVWFVRVTSGDVQHTFRVPLLR
jgi:PKD repeat protein